ncbi:MAG TPA: hypothetical protein VF774_26580 [Pseudoduganella sp.]
MTTTSANCSAAAVPAEYTAHKAAVIFNKVGVRMDELAIVGEHYTVPIKSASLGLRRGAPFAIVLSLPQRSRENETMRQDEFGSLEQHCDTNRGVDELHETAHNRLSLLLTNTTICRRVRRIRSKPSRAEFFNNQQSISVGV